jgi:uncharacterized protein YjbI with pentapeptide repeats
MKKLFFILLCAISVQSQTAPNLKFRLLTNGTVEVTWPVEKIFPAAPDLRPSYRIETSDSRFSWAPQTNLIRGVDFTNDARIQIDLSQPAAFVRIRSILDFSGRTFLLRNFSGASFQDAAFQAADLRASDLRGADFSGADLTLARLSDANCGSADFLNANLRFVDLTGADISFARLDNADLRGAILQSTTNNYTRFHGTRVDAITVMDPIVRSIWQIVNDQGAGKSFDGLDLSFTDLSTGNLTNATFRNADLSGVDFQLAKLSGANLSTANLRLVDFRGAILSASTQIATKWRTVHDILNNPRSNRILTSADLTLGFWVNAVLDQADLRSARFSNGVFFDSSFVTANATGALFTAVDFNNVDFRNANLSGANFTDAHFDGCDLLGATTTSAVFTRTTFTNTRMPDGSFR